MVRNIFDEKSKGSGVKSKIAHAATPNQELAKNYTHH